MPVSDDDAQLVKGLIELLRRHRAGWVAAEVEEAQTLRTDYEADAEMLLVAIAETVGLVPSLLLGATDALGAAPGPVRGVAFEEIEIYFDTGTVDELLALQEDAAVLRRPIADVLDARHPTTE